MAYKRTEPDPTLQQFGALLRKQRVRKSMDQDEVAVKLGVSQGTLHNWETGITCPPLLKAIAWCEMFTLDLWPHGPGEI